MAIWHRPAEYGMRAVLTLISLQMEGAGGHPGQYPGYSSCGAGWNNNLPPQHVQNSYSLAGHGQPSPLPPGGPQGGPGSAPVPSPLYPWMRSQFGKLEPQFDPPSDSAYSELETGADSVQGWDSSSDSGYHDIGRTPPPYIAPPALRK